MPTEPQQTDIVSEARELLAKATPGPWGVLPSNNGTLAQVEKERDRYKRLYEL